MSLLACLSFVHSFSLTTSHTSSCWAPPTWLAGTCTTKSLRCVLRQVPWMKRNHKLLGLLLLSCGVILSDCRSCERQLDSATSSRTHQSHSAESFRVHGCGYCSICGLCYTVLCCIVLYRIAFRQSVRSWSDTLWSCPPKWATSWCSMRTRPQRASTRTRASHPSSCLADLVSSDPRSSLAPFNRSICYSVCCCRRKAQPHACERTRMSHPSSCLAGLVRSDPRTLLVPFKSMCHFFSLL